MTMRIETQMGTTFVELRSQGFWMQDGMLELWLRLLVLHIDDPTQPGSRATVIREQWLLASKGLFHGCVPHNLNQFALDAEGQFLVRQAVLSLMTALRGAPELLSNDVINLMGMKDGFGGPVERDSLLEIGRAFIDLLDGNLHGTDSDTSFMPGSRRR